MMFIIATVFIFLINKLSSWESQNKDNPKCFKTLGSHDAVQRSIYAFILSCFEYCSPVWSSGFDCHLRLLDRALGNIRFILPDLSIDLEERREIASLSLVYKILNNVDQPLHCKLPQFAVPTRATRQATRQNERTFFLLRQHTTQFQRCFVNSSANLWSSLFCRVF